MAPANRIQLTSGALHVESNGDPLGHLILCVHGLSANRRSFDRFVPVLAGLGRTYPSAPDVLSHMQAAGTIAPWDEFWDSYFEWELEPVDNTVRTRTDLAAVSEDSAYASTHDVYELWPRLRCPVLLVRASRPMVPGGDLVVSLSDAERFAAEACDATVVDVDADHYSILISPPAISAVERFVGAGAA
jgi:3-oxoadipate enol-lactonase